MKRFINKIKSNNKGETLIETLVALLIIVVSIVALAGSIVSAASINKKTMDLKTEFIEAVDKSGDMTVDFYGLDSSYKDTITIIGGMNRLQASPPLMLSAKSGSIIGEVDGKEITIEKYDTEEPHTYGHYVYYGELSGGEPITTKFVVFMVDDGVYAQEEVDETGYVTLPEDNPTAPEGYHFGGWRKPDGTNLSDEDIINETLTVNAVWVKDAIELKVIAGSSTKTYDGTPLTNGSYTYEGALISGDYLEVTIDEDSTITNVGTVNNNITSCVVRGYREGILEDVSSEYDITLVAGTLTVQPAEVTVKADAKNKIYGENDPELTATVSELVNGETAEEKILYSVRREEGEDVDEYDIIPSGEEYQNNYHIKYVTAEKGFEIKKSDKLTVSPPDDCSFTYNGAIHGYPAVAKIDDVPTDIANILYSTDGDSWSTDCPTISAVDDYDNDSRSIDVQVKAEHQNYETAKCSYTLTMNKASGLEVHGNEPYEWSYDGEFHGNEATASINRIDTEDAMILYSTSVDEINWSEWSLTVASIKDIGKLYVQVKAKHLNYLSAQSSYTLEIGKKSGLHVRGIPYPEPPEDPENPGDPGIYDGQPHGGVPAVVTCNDGEVPSDVTVSYSTDEGANWVENPPTITNVGSTHVWVKAEHYLYQTAEDSYYLTVIPAGINKPTAHENLVYDGTKQTGVDGGTGYTISGNKGTNAGSYTATATLDDNHIWSDESTDPVTVPWTIKRKEISKPTANNLTYNGTEQTGVNTGTGYTISENTGTNAGLYTATATPDSNHAWIGGSTDSASISWTIKRKEISKPTANNLTYNGSEQTGVNTGTGYTISGNTGTNAGSYTATVTPDSNHAWIGGSTSEASISWSIARLNTASVSYGDKDYTGSQQTGVTGSYVSLTGTYTATEPGTYTAYATPDSNHAWSDGTTDTKTITWKINNRQVTLYVKVRRRNGTRYSDYDREIVVQYGSNAECTATPSQSGLDFDGWSLSSSSNNYISTNSKYTVTNNNIVVKNMTEDVTVYAVYSGSCIAEGTLITLADGSYKPVEDITADDIVLVFNHETGELDVSTMPLMVHNGLGAELSQVITLVFDDGTKLRIVADHGLFDYEKKEYIYIDESNYKEYLGHSFLKESFADGVGETSTTKLVDVYITEETIRYFAPISKYHLNYFSNGLLSMTSLMDGLFNIFELDESLKYDEEKMAEDIAKYGLLSYEDYTPYEGAYPELYDYFPAQYFGVSMGKGMITIEHIFELANEYFTPENFLMGEIPAVENSIKTNGTFGKESRLEKLMQNKLYWE